MVFIPKRGRRGDAGRERDLGGRSGRWSHCGGLFIESIFVVRVAVEFSARRPVEERVVVEFFDQVKAFVESDRAKGRSVRVEFRSQSRRGVGNEDLDEFVLFLICVYEFLGMC